jgi:glycosyltransferase involved in cell wall biosynthesis
MPAISIIVPVYNTEKYLKKCIESILQQTFIDFELILIDDGSTDFSGIICDTYREHDERVKVIHKKNGGVAAARNTGLLIAKGGYISFIDSDDWIDCEFYSYILKYMNKNVDIDICVSGMKREGHDNYTSWSLKRGKKQVLTNIEAVKSMLEQELFRWELCDKVYQRKLFINYSFDETLSMGEDFASNWYLFHKAQSILYYPIFGYHYRMRNDSVTHLSYNGDRIFLDALNKVMDDYDKMDDTMQKYMLRWYVTDIMKNILKMFFWDEVKYELKIKFYKQRLHERQLDKKILTLLTLHEKLLLKIFALEDSHCQKIMWYRYKKSCDYIKKICKKYKTVYIYGTGVLGQYIEEIFKRETLKFTAFIISDNQYTKGQFDGYSVRYLSQLKENKQQSVFILGLNTIYKNEVEKSLNNYGYKNIYWPEFCKFF